MKRILMVVSAFVAMLVVGSNMVTTASAQEVQTERIEQDAAVVESLENGELVAAIKADSTLQNRGAETVIAPEDAYVVVYLNLTSDKPKIDSIYIPKPKPITKAEDVSDESTEAVEEAAEEPAEEITTAVPNKRFERVIVRGAGRNRYGKYTSQCAAHVNGRLSRAGYYSNGHAYQILAQFPSVVNGYKGVKIPDLSKVSADKRYATVLHMHRQAADYVKEHLDISKLVPGKYYVVNMYYSTSRYMLQFFYSARKQGTGNYGTHVGVLYYDTKHQAWIVEHNIHGSVYYDALVSILGGSSNPNKYGITSIARVSK